MFTKKPSREWLRVASSLVVLLSGTMLPDGNVLVEWHTGREVDTGGPPVDGGSERRMACRL